MTKEEQLDWLCRLRSDISYMDFSIDINVSLERKRKYIQVLSEIIKALEQEPTNKNDLGVDCIKKSDAINIIQDMHGLARADVISDAVNRIITMSSVTPQPCKDAVSRQEVLYLIADNDLSMGQVVRGIHALPPVTPQEPRWIPVSERMPDIHNYSEYYLVTLKNGEVHRAMCTEMNGEHWWNYNLDDVIAWMPLPQPYSEVKE